MCRIAGYIGPQSNRRIATILRGFIMAEEKGNPHGTGVITKELKSKRNYLAKKGIRGREFLVRGHADFLFQERFNFAFMHVRYMTSGEQSDRCSHPFGFRVKGTWHFGMHNGVFSDVLCDKLCEKFKCSKAKVDSETFFWALQSLQNREKGLEEAIAEVTEFISDNGEYAFTYMTPDAVYLWRSEGRPLSVFDLRERHMGRWFASTADMFKKALKMAGAGIEKVNGFELKPFRLYKVGHKTDPVWEVEPVCDLPKPPPRLKPISLYDFSRWQQGSAETGKLFDDYDNVDPDFPSGDEMDEMMEEFNLLDPATLSNKELDREISKVSEMIDAFGLTSDLQDYLADAIYEREKRKREGEAKNMEGGQNGRRTQRR